MMLVMVMMFLLMMKIAKRCPEALTASIATGMINDAYNHVDMLFVVMNIMTMMMVLV